MEALLYVDLVVGVRTDRRLVTRVPSLLIERHLLVPRDTSTPEPPVSTPLTYDKLSG